MSRVYVLTIRYASDNKKSTIKDDMEELSKIFYLLNLKVLSLKLKLSKNIWPTSCDFPAK